MILTCRQMQEVEEAAFARGVKAADLMEKAGLGIAEVVRQFFPEPGMLVLFLGKGNNAGDALVAARHLISHGWKVRARVAFPLEQWKPLPVEHWDKLSRAVAPDDLLAEDWRMARGPMVLMDGLIGIGGSGNLRGPLAEAAREMNDFRKQRHAVTIALDLPSGLDNETGAPGAPCVEADITATIGFVKAPLLADEALRNVGRLAVIRLPELEAYFPTQEDDGVGGEIIMAATLLPTLPCRPFDFHKGSAGRVGIVAGSPGFIGAAILSASAALHGGGGLLTLYVKDDIFDAAAMKAPPEVMVKRVADYRDCLDDRLDAIGLGPGLGSAHDDEVHTLLRSFPGPMVVDADGLNLLARTGVETLRDCAGPRLLTPHPGEMARLAPEMKGLSRREQASQFAGAYPGVTLLLKGSRTVIAEAGSPLAYNTTGNAGMATGGQGDVLTGLCAALAGQGMGLREAACLGAWLCGRAAELAISHGTSSQESLSAGDVVSHFGAAFQSLRRLAF